MKRNALGVAVLTTLFLGQGASTVVRADETVTQDLSNKVEAAAEAIKNYSVAQKDEAINSAKATLEDLDARIQQMEERLDQQWSQMDKVARDTARATLSKLHAQRTELADWYGQLKQSSAAAWEQVRQGFVDSYEVLRSAVANAQKGF